MPLILFSEISHHTKIMPLFFYYVKNVFLIHLDCTSSPHHGHIASHSLLSLFAQASSPALPIPHPWHWQWPPCCFSCGHLCGPHVSLQLVLTPALFACLCCAPPHAFLWLLSTKVLCWAQYWPLLYPVHLTRLVLSFHLVTSNASCTLIPPKTHPLLHHQSSIPYCLSHGSIWVLKTWQNRAPDPPSTSPLFSNSGNGNHLLIVPPHIINSSFSHNLPSACGNLLVAPLPNAQSPALLATSTLRTFPGNHCLSSGLLQ